MNKSKLPASNIINRQMVEVEPGYGFVHVQFGGETGIYVGHLIGQVFHCLRLSGECYRQFQSYSLFVVHFFKKGK